MSKSLVVVWELTFPVMATWETATYYIRSEKYITLFICKGMFYMNSKYFFFIRRTSIKKKKIMFTIYPKRLLPSISNNDTDKPLHVQNRFGSTGNQFPLHATTAFQQPYNQRDFRRMKYQYSIHAIRGTENQQSRGEMDQRTLWRVTQSSVVTRPSLSPSRREPGDYRLVTAQSHSPPRGDDRDGGGGWQETGRDWKGEGMEGDAW